MPKLTIDMHLEFDDWKKFCADTDGFLSERYSVAQWVKRKMRAAFAPHKVQFIEMNVRSEDTVYAETTNEAGAQESHVHSAPEGNIPLAG